jgi:hypothetical protein
MSLAKKQQSNGQGQQCVFDFPYIYERTLCFTLWGRTLKVDASEFSTRSNFISCAKGKGASGSKVTSEDINVGNEISEWV